MEDLSTGMEYEKELTRIFNRFNKHFWNKELPEVLITFSPTKGAHGHMTTEPVWKPADDDKEKGKYELNISAYTINRTPEEICATLLHEQCHLYNIIHGIKDCSNGNRYHNKRFKKAAETHGLICDKYSSTIGWSHTVLDEEAKKYVVHLNVKQFELKRAEPAKMPPTLIRCECSKCGNFCYVTHKMFREHSVVCGECGKQMLAEWEEDE